MEDDGGSGAVSICLTLALPVGRASIVVPFIATLCTAFVYDFVAPMMFSVSSPCVFLLRWIQACPSSCTWHSIRISQQAVNGFLFSSLSLFLVFRPWISDREYSHMRQPTRHTL
jgi:hypothetical protein